MKKNTWKTKILSLFLMMVLLFGNGSDVQAEELPNVTWGQHLGDKNNNALIFAKTPVKGAKLLWKSYSNAPEIWGSVYAGTPILVDGKIYAVRNNRIEMLDAKTGEVKVSTALHANIGYYSNIIYGGGMVFVPLGDGTIQCFRADTLTSMYLIANPVASGSSLSVNGAMHYDDGKLYAGYSDGAFTNPSGCYAAYDTVDLDVTNETELVNPLWKTEIGQSYYGSGAVSIGDVVVIAGDDGNVFSHHAIRGDQISSCNLQGAVRGPLVYAEGFVWAATKDKRIYKIAVSEDGQLSVVENAALPGSTNASPVVYDGKVYISGGSFGEGGFFAVYDKNLNLLSKAKSDNTLNTVTVTTAYNDIYAYCAENGPEGCLYMAKVENNHQITLSKLYTPEHPQYSMSKVVAGADGTLFYGNDAGYLYALVESQSVEPQETEETAKETEDTPKQEPSKTTKVSNVRKIEIDASSEEEEISLGIPEAITESNKKKEPSLTICNPPEILEAEVFATLAKYPDFQLILDCGTYTLSMKGADVINTGTDLNTKLLESGTKLTKEQEALYGNYQILSFEQRNGIPGKITVVYRLGESFDQVKELYLYQLSNPENAVRAVFQKPYAMFSLEEGGEYIISDQMPESEVEDVIEAEEETEVEKSTEEPVVENEKSNIPMWLYILSGLGVCALLGGTIIVKVISVRKRKNTWES